MILRFREMGSAFRNGESAGARDRVTFSRSREPAAGTGLRRRIVIPALESKARRPAGARTGKRFVGHGLQKEGTPGCRSDEAFLIMWRQ